MSEYIVLHGIRVAKDFTPETFHRLTSIGPKFRYGNHTLQVFSCDCGDSHVCRPIYVKTGHTKSCGCLHKEKISKGNPIHNMSRTSTHAIWRGMIDRCSTEKTTPHINYGGRGITVCDRWREPNGQGFINFLADMGERPSKSHSMDRHPNPDGNYEPGNCRWATRQEQNRNQRSNINITFNGKTQCISAWADELGMAAGTLHNRLWNKWTVERAFTQPARKR